MSRKIKWGVLGYARIAQIHVIPAIIEAENAEFYAIASRDSSKVGRCKEKFGCSAGYDNYEDLLNDPTVEAVYIPLPNDMHKEWTIRAARKGKHVLCEKPAALNSKELTEMIDVCKQENVKLMEAFMYRFSNRTRMLLDILDKNPIGEIKHIYSTFRTLLERPGDIRWDSKHGGGAFYDLGSYTINTVGMITKREPVSMESLCIPKNGVDLSFSASLIYDNGIMATISGGFDGFLNTFTQITGTKGVIEVDNAILGCEGVIKIRTGGGIKKINVDPCNAYANQIEDFSNAIIHQREPGFSLEESLRNMKVMERLQKLF